MPDRLAEQGALQNVISDTETNPKRLSLAGYIRGLFLDWATNPVNPLSRLTARGRYYGYFWDNGVMPLYMDFANQQYTVSKGTIQSASFSDIVTFSRASNATVTNSAGLISYAPHNLLAYSEQFDNSAWAKFNTTVSANTTAAPNGTITADTLNEGTANNVHQITYGFAFASATNYTLTVYAKYINNPYLYLSATNYSSGTTYASAAFNIQTGTYITSAASGTGYSVVGTPTITPAGNGWYRCSVTITFGTGSTVGNSAFFVYMGNTGTIGAYGGESYTGTSRTAYIWGAQLEIGSTATTYNPTTVKNLLGYSELFDNAAWTKSNSFVQTNLLTYSEQFNNAYWAQTFGATVTADDTLAPNGYQTADKITISGNDIFRNVNGIAIATATTYTESFYIKKNDFNWIRFNATDSTTSTNSVRVWFNINTGVVGSNTTSGTGWTYVSSSITDAGNGWYRCSVTFTTTGTSLFLIIASADGDASLTRAPSGSSYYLWGAQLVQGAVAGDYRRTDSAALPVYYNGPFGYTGAEKLVETTTASSNHYINNIAVAFANYNGGVVYSVYAKAGERSKLYVGYSSAGNLTQTYATFDLNTQATTVVNAFAWPVAVASIVPIGNGWYRCAFRVSTGGSAYNPNATIATIDNSGNISYTGDGTSGLYLWGAQLSDSASLDTYVCNAGAAPSAAAYYGPRFDYDPVTKQPKGLLIEEQRANVVPYSDDFRDTAAAGIARPWIYNAISLSSNAVVSPDGTQNADTIIENSANDLHVDFQAISITTSIAYTVSCYAKAGTRNYAMLRVGGGGFATAPAVKATLTGNGAVSTIEGPVTSSSIVSVGNGWYRIIFTFTSGTTASHNPQIGPHDNGSSTIYQGNGTGSISVWGMQLEAGAFATSYIPTVASSVTRSADVAVIQGSNFYSWYNSNEGSLYANIIPQGAISSSTRVVNLTDNTNRTVDIYLGTLTGMYNGTATLTTGPATLNTSYKVIGAYKTANYGLTSNGATPAFSNTATVYLATVLYLGSYDNNSQKLNGTIKSISYYNKRLDNNTLVGLTK